MLTANTMGKATLGVSGSRWGWKPQQEKYVHMLFDCWEFDEMHHGECQGVDEQFHHLALERGIPIIIHPPIKDEFRSTVCSGYAGRREEKNYFVRNCDIVNEASLMVTVPGHMNREKGGTWHATKYAIKKEKTLIILLPTGAVEIYGVQDNGKYGRVYPKAKDFPE